MIETLEKGADIATEVSGKKLEAVAQELSKIPDVSGLQSEIAKIDGNEERIKFDDNDKPYLEDGKLLPNQTCTLNGSVYKTDDRCRTINCESKPQQTPENSRDNKAQSMVGGNDRKETDQGGHIVGRDMNGDGGLGNLICMDSRINQSDYKRMENDVKKALEEGKDVTMKTDIVYSGESERPDKIVTTVTIDGKVTVYTFDNNLNGSLMDKVKEKSSPSDIETVQTKLDEKGGQISSIKEEYDANGSLVQTTVNITYIGNDGKNLRIPVIITNGGSTYERN